MQPQSTPAAGASNTLGSKAKSLHSQSAQRVAGGVPLAKSGAYTLRQEAGRLLFDSSAGKRQKHRVCHCGRSLNGNFASIFRAADGSRARIAGTVSCGSGWDCPVCAWRIGEARGAELQTASDRWHKAGGHAHLITQTFPHEADTPLAELMAKFDSARQRFRNCAKFKAILGSKGAAGCIGTVGSLEITVGRNGWHPHLHTVAFTRRPLDAREVETLSAEWVRILLKVGLGTVADITAMSEHALDIRGASDAADYLTKWGRADFWGLGSELTAEHAKDAKGDNLKPFGLLRVSLSDDDNPEASARAARLFREYAEEFHGRRLLIWSPGLREWFGLADDEDLVAADRHEAAEASQFVGQLDFEQWKIVLSRGAVAELVDYAAGACLNPDTGQRDLNEWVEWIAERPRTSGGWFWTPMRRLPPWAH